MCVHAPPPPHGHVCMCDIFKGLNEQQYWTDNRIGKIIQQISDQSFSIDLFIKKETDEEDPIQTKIVIIPATISSCPQEQFPRLTDRHV